MEPTMVPLSGVEALLGPTTWLSMRAFLT